jgi:hypothetical protein
MIQLFLNNERGSFSQIYQNTKFDQNQHSDKTEEFLSSKQPTCLSPEDQLIPNIAKLDNKTQGLHGTSSG